MRVLSCAADTQRRIKAGAGMTTHRKPKPSTARNTSKASMPVAKPPKALASVSKPKPANTLRRKPTLSTLKPTAKPSVMPASCTIESKKPACTKLKDKAACSTGKAGGILPTCKAAHTPASTTTQDG